MDHTSRRTRFIQLLVERGLLGDVTFRLADVGASGGIDSKWSAFGNRLEAIGFEPLIAEVDRLNAAEQQAGVKYEAAFVGSPAVDELFPPALRQDRLATRFNQPFERSSAVAADAIMRRDRIKEHYNRGSEVRYTDRHVSLDERFAPPEPPPDCIKIDTDGSDLYVLLGAEHLLERGNVLGIEVECQFHGAVHPCANVFSNIDRFLRERGFTLFDIAAYRYSRAALPAPFAINMAAQTESGQVHWGDAVYLRDLGHPDYDRMFEYRTTLEKALKLCCLFEIYGLQDCAVELLLRCQQAGWLVDAEPLLDVLTPTLFGPLSYREYIGRFETDPDAFMPSRMERALAAAPSPERGRIAALVSSLAEARAEISALRERIARDKQDKEVLKERLRERGDRIEKLTRRLKAPQ